MDVHRLKKPDSSSCVFEVGGFSTGAPPVSFVPGLLTQYFLPFWANQPTERPR